MADHVSDGLSSFAQATEMHTEIYGADCCWILTQRGIERYPAGDASHPFSFTRIPYTVRNITMPLIHEERAIKVDHVFATNEGCQGGPTVVIRGGCRDIFLPTLQCKDLDALRVFHTLEENLVDVASLRNLIRELRIPLRDLAALFYLSGSDHSPHTRGIGHEGYIEAFFINRKTTGNLLSA